MPWLVHNNGKRNSTHHTLCLLLPKHRSAAEKATVPRPFGAQASWAGWKQHISQHLPTLLLSVTSLVIRTCCSVKACSVISSAASYMCVSIHTSFVAVLTFLLQIFVPQIKTALHIFILSILHIHPLFFFYVPALLPPFPLSWHANIRCPNLTSLMERFVKHSSLGGKKKRESMRSFAVRQV